MTQAWLDAELALEERVEAFVANLDPEELAAIPLGDFAALTGRGLPVPDYVDAGTGLRDVPGATAFPAGIALAATFDPGLAEEYGAAVGAEARDAGFTVVLGPTLDLARDPRAGRIPEALGEDPYLSGLLGAAHVRGLQAQHVIAQLKHFIAYNGEDRRTGYGLEPDRGDSMDVRVSNAVLQDSYLRPFKAAIEAGAWSMMGSYNQINGEYACESDLLAIPRRDWGWLGFYCPDFLFAVRDDAKALAAGMDLGALGGPGRRTPEMIAAAPAGVVEALVTNLTRALIGSGLADHPLPAKAMPSTSLHLDVAERAAVASSVLLRNQNQALPFGPDVTSLAVIGPSGTDAMFVTGGSGAVSLTDDRVITPAAGILARADNRHVEVAQGSLGDVLLPVVTADAFTLPDGSASGVAVEFVDQAGNTWSEVFPAIDHTVDQPNPASRWPKRWRTLLTSRETGAHRLSLALGGRATVRLDGEPIMVGSREVERFFEGPAYPMQAVVELTAGIPASLEIDFEPGPTFCIPQMGLGPTLRLGWQPPGDLIGQAVAAAAGCDAAVVLVNMACGEGMDRDSLALPGDQDELVRRVAAANQRTVVVLNTPGAVLMPWLDDVSAVLQVWYPGERFGASLAAVLFGEAEPGGRLPLTFPHAREHLPGGDHGPETVPTRIDYDADGGIGYRAPTIRQHGALFAFGHGLGYAETSCALSTALVVDGKLRLGLTVDNPGERDSVHVAQIYVEIADSAPELIRVLRVPVAARLTANAEVAIAAEDLARWHEPSGRRVPVPGRHRVRIASSSVDPGVGVQVTIAGGELVG